MTITSQNELPHLVFPIGCSNKTSNDLSALYNNGEALNTGSLAYYLHINLVSPNLVHSYESFDGPQPFDPIRLTGAICNPMDDDASYLGVFSAIILYNTPFVEKVTSMTILISFALGISMSVNDIVRIPLIRQL